MLPSSLKLSCDEQDAAKTDKDVASPGPHMAIGEMGQPSGETWDLLGRMQAGRINKAIDLERSQAERASEVVSSLDQRRHQRVSPDTSRCVCGHDSKSKVSWYKIIRQLLDSGHPLRVPFS